MVELMEIWYGWIGGDGIWDMGGLEEMVYGIFEEMVYGIWEEGNNEDMWYGKIGVKGYGIWEDWSKGIWDMGGLE